MSDLQARQLLRLSTLLQLEKRVRAASLQELSFIVVNETQRVVDYRQAALWQSEPTPKIVAASGVAIVDSEAPYIVWLNRLCSHLRSRNPSQICEFESDQVEGFGAEWREWFPRYLIWIPSPSLSGALILARDAPLSESERQLSELLVDAYAHAWLAQIKRRPLRTAGITLLRGKRLTAVALLALVALGFVPVRQSVLAPAEVIPLDPVVVRAPLDGVVDKVLVKPNEHVVEGQVLFALDPRRLRNQLTVALRAEEAAETEFRQARQFAVTDQKVRATLPVLQGKLEQQAAEVAYLKAQLERTSVRATRSGLAVFDDANDWPGKPVVIGERVMLVADPEKIQLEARLPVADAVALDIGSPVRLFLNVDPTSPREAVLTFVSYQPQKDVDGILSYRIKASFAEGESRPRIGLKGTAKLYGDDVSLAAAMLRRPISAARQWLGF
jgi:hypothetical protein